MPTEVIDDPAIEPITELTDQEQAILDTPSDVVEQGETEQQTTGEDQSADDFSAAPSAGEAADKTELSRSQLRDLAQELDVPSEGSSEQLEQAILGKQAPAADSRMDQLTELAQSYGIGEQAARQFETPAALERALGLVEQHYLAEGQKQLQQPDQQQQQQQQPAAQQPSAEQADPNAFKLQWGEDGVEEDDLYARNMQGLAGETQRLQSELAQLRGQMGQQRELEIYQYAAQELSAFNGHVDHMDAGMFGGTKNVLTDSEDANRNKLWESAKILQAGMASRGIEVSLTPQFIERAQHHAFADQLQQSERKRLIDRVRKQSNRRTGSGSPSRSYVEDSHEGDIADDPEIKKMYDGFVEANA